MIATGGGAFADPANRAMLRSDGAIVFYLRASPRLLALRVTRSRKRPLLAGMEPVGRIKELLKQREPTYLMANYSVDTDGLDLDQTVARILAILGGATLKFHLPRRLPAA